ncbi:hypothetical protein GGC47_004933 [Bosea sp. OAE752]|uniref:hypothetical protein n=1 Tax=Bosea sp. OAE752 TaxID=2663873 RepID=UPI003D1B3BC6
MNDIEDGEVIVVLRQNVKRGGELMATYQMDYPDWASAQAGRVEAIQVGSRQLSGDEIAALSRRRS